MKNKQKVGGMNIEQVNDIYNLVSDIEVSLLKILDKLYGEPNVVSFKRQVTSMLQKIPGMYARLAKYHDEAAGDR